MTSGRSRYKVGFDHVTAFPIPVFLHLCGRISPSSGNGPLPEKHSRRRNHFGAAQTPFPLKLSPTPRPLQTVSLVRQIRLPKLPLPIFLVLRLNIFFTAQKQQRQTSLSLTPCITDGLRALTSRRTGTTCFVDSLFSLLRAEMLASGQCNVPLCADIIGSTK